MSKKLRDIISNEISEEFFSEEKDPYVYHGTKETNIKSIKERGLNSFINHFHTNWHYARQWGPPKGGSLLRVHRKNLPGSRSETSDGHVYTKYSVRPKFLEIHKEGKWKRLLDESEVRGMMTEMPTLSGDAHYLDHKQGAHHDPKDVEKSFYTTKMGIFQGHHVLKNTAPGFEGFYLYNPRRKHIALQLKGYLDDYDKSLRIKWSQKRSDCPVKMSDFMHHLITKHGFTINSDQSLSSKAIKAWSHLSKNPDIDTKLIKFGGEIKPLQKPMGLNIGDYWEVFQAKKK